jgi:hypothetical protein
MLRTRVLSGALLLCGMSWTPETPAADPAVRAELGCRREVSPGRVQCELVVTAVTGRLVWADALVVGVPEFTRPLRSRVGPKQALRRSERQYTLPISLAATKNGRGELRVEARAVICTSKVNGCTPLTKVSIADVEVGAREQR